MVCEYCWLGLVDGLCLIVLFNGDAFNRLFLVWLFCLLGCLCLRVVG